MIVKALIVTCFLSLHLTKCAETFNVLNYGAKSDGHFVNTEAIRKSIEAASSAGGGTVLFPSGHYLTGPIHLKSNVSLHLDDGVLLKFTDHFDDYLPMVKVRWEGTELINFSPLIYGNSVTNVSITGTGNATLDGSGKKWWDFFKHLKSEHKKTGHYNTSSKWQVEFHKLNHQLMKNRSEYLDDAGMISQGFLRPQFYQPIDSTHLTLSGLRFIDSPFWTVTPAFSDYIHIDGLTILNPSNAPNTDGIDPDSCRHVTIRNCTIDTGDDCVCIKSGKDKQGRMLNRPSENITISDCTMHSGHGGLVIGSEMSGGVRNIRAHNLHFNGTLRGIRIKSTRGRGGIVEDVLISGVTMSNITKEGITINTYYTKAAEEPLSERTPFFRNIHIDNVTGESKIGITILGLPEKHLENIQLTNIHMDAKKDLNITYADNVIQTNVTYINTKHHHGEHHGETTKTVNQ